MTYEFFAILKDGTEVSVVNEDIDFVKKAMQDFIQEHYDTGWSHCTMYLPHEMPAEWPKTLARKRCVEEQAKLAKKGKKK